MGWEPALPPAKCFEGVCLCQFELHRDLRPQAAGAQYLPSSYGFGLGSVKQDLTRDHRPTSCFPGNPHRPLQMLPFDEQFTELDIGAHAAKAHFVRIA